MKRYTASMLSIAAVTATIAQAQSPRVAPPSLVEAVVYSTIRPPNQDIYLYERPRERSRHNSNGSSSDACA